MQSYEIKQVNAILRLVRKMIKLVMVKLVRRDGWQN